MMSIVIKAAAGIFLLHLAAFAQSSPPGGTVGASGASGASGAPVYVLYRLFFRDVAAKDATALQLDAAGQPGGSDLRGSYQKSLFLSDAQAALLKQNAASCNSSLDQQHASALPTIAALRAALASLPPGAAIPPPPASIAALEQTRTDISNACIASLHAALGDKTFANIDVFVRTKFARKVSLVPPANSPFVSTPPTRLGATSGAAGGGN
jgi:hypothetical protein